jgi:hypothetical protein
MQEGRLRSCVDGLPDVAAGMIIKNSGDELAAADV